MILKISAGFFPVLKYGEFKNTSNLFNSVLSKALNISIKDVFYI